MKIQKLSIFINSFHLHADEIEKNSRPFNTEELNLNELKALSKVSFNKQVQFWEVIDPKVSGIFNRNFFEYI